MEPDPAEEVAWVAARSEGYNEVVDMPDESVSGDLLYLADSVLGREVQQVAGSDHVVDILAAEGGGLLENAQGCCRNGGENSEDEHEGLFENAQSCYRNGGESREEEPEVQEEQPVGQSQRPACIRRPPDRYGEWILNSL